jgi:transposase
VDKVRAKLFELTKQEGKELRQRYRQEENRRIADRIQCILLLDAGHNKQEVASILMVSAKTVKRWVKKYAEAGLEGLCRLGYEKNGQGGGLNEAEREQLLSWLEAAGICSAKEVMNYIGQTFAKEYSQSGIEKLLKRLGYSYKKPAVVPAKADPVQQAEFVQQYQLIQAGLAEDDKIYFLDASHFLHNAIAGYGWSKRGQRVELKTNSGRNRFNVLGAYSPADRCLIRVEGTDKCDARMVVKLLLRLRRANRQADLSAQAGKLILILDNAPYQHAKLVKRAARRLGITLCYLPPYSPNLNLIERLWKFTKAQVLKNKYYATFAQFQAALEHFLDHLDQHATELSTLLTENFQLFATT